MDNIEPILPNQRSAQYSKEDIEHSLKVLLANPDLLDQLIEGKEQEKGRRKNWSRLSKSSYYNKRFGLELRNVVDSMLERGQDMEYRCDDYPELKPATIYLRVNHAKLYILDYLDEGGKYQQAFRRIHIGYSPNKTGVRLTLMKMVNDSIHPVPISYDEKHDTWKDKVDEYVSNVKPGDEPLLLRNLSLTSDEVQALRESFIQLSHIGAIVMPTEIKIMCFPKPE